MKKNPNSRKRNGDLLVADIINIGSSLRLKSAPKVKKGLGVNRQPREIPVVFVHGSKELAVDCIFQKGTGSANMKFFGLVRDMELLKKDFDLSGVIVFAGRGFPKEFPGRMIEDGAIPLRDLRQFLKTYFGLTGNVSPLARSLELQDIELGGEKSGMLCSKCDADLTVDEYIRLPWNSKGPIGLLCKTCQRP